MIGTTLLLLGCTFLWSKIQPEQVYAVCQGYAQQDLKLINGLSFKELVVYWGFEVASLLAILNMAKGLMFSMMINYSQSLTSWQHWFGLCCLLAFTANPEVSPALTFWKRWAVFLGAAAPLLLPLAQLSLAVFLALLLLTRRKKVFVCSGSIAGMVITLSNNLPPFEAMFMLAACFIAGFGRTLTIQNIPFTKRASEPV